MKQTLLLCCCLAFAGALSAQTGSNYTRAEANEMVAAHNVHRKEVGTKPVTWSNEVAAYAQEWANKLAREDCQMEHRTTNRYGENIFWGWGGKYTPTVITDGWASEKTLWKGGKITTDNYNVAGHYTQVIWFSTTEIGCGYAMCDEGEKIVVCNYAPAGNVLGRTPLGN